jgi:potassium channel subfamily K protein
MFNSIGERLNNFSSIVINKVRKTVKAKQKEATEMDLICVVSSLSAIVTTTGAAAFSHYEGNFEQTRPYYVKIL